MYTFEPTRSQCEGSAGPVGLGAHKSLWARPPLQCMSRALTLEREGALDVQARSQGLSAVVTSDRPRTRGGLQHMKGHKQREGLIKRRSSRLMDLVDEQEWLNKMLKGAPPAAHGAALRQWGTLHGFLCMIGFSLGLADECMVCRNTSVQERAASGSGMHFPHHHERLGKRSSPRPHGRQDPRV